MWPFSPFCPTQKPLLDGLRRIESKLDTITMTLTDAFTSLAASDAELKKDLAEVSTNTATLVQQVADLKAALANVSLTPEQQATVDSIAATAQTLDAIVPDAPTA